jgi:hypothetical protein
LIGVITIIGCSSNEIPNYLVLNSEISDTKSKTLYALEVATNAKLPEGDTKLLLNHLYDSIMSTEVYEHRNHPNAVRISVYETREHFESGMGQWMGMISKAENDNSPNIEINQPAPISSNFEKENENLLNEMDTQTQKEIWNELIIAEDKSNAEAEKKYPIKVTGKTIAEINNQKEIAEKNSAKHYEYQENLLKKYKEDIREKYNINDTIIKAITNKGLEENWAFPKYE